MRTTLTLDPDVARLIEEEAHRQRKSIKEIVNDAIRRALAPGARNRAETPYRVQPHRTRLRPGIDPGALNRLADDLEVEDAIEKLKGGE